MFPVASYHRNQDKPDGPLGSYADFTLSTTTKLIDGSGVLKVRRGPNIICRRWVSIATLEVGTIPRSSLHTLKYISKILQRFTSMSREMICNDQLTELYM